MTKTSADTASVATDNSLIEVRDYSFPVDHRETPNWFANDVVQSSFADAFSLCLPEGERFFIRSVTPFLDRLPDDDMRTRVKKFIRQEAYHTREHERYNACLAAMGHDVETMMARVHDTLPHQQSDLFRLALTCAIEHMTATFAHVMLRNPEILEDAEQGYADFWFWHALEEAEHRSVAFDVYRAVTPSLSAWKRYALRVTLFLAATRHMGRIQTRNMYQIYRHRNGGGPLAFVASTGYGLFIKPGIVRKGLLHYLAYLKPGFHPEEGNWEPVLRRWKAYFRERDASYSSSSSSSNQRVPS